jgi:hypothetical protein
MDSTSTNLPGIAAVNELLQIWQMCCNPEVASYRTRDHHEWMALQEGPEADGRPPHPEVDGLPGFDVKWLLKLDADPDRAMFVCNEGRKGQNNPMVRMEDFQTGNVTGAGG